MKKVIWEKDVYNYHLDGEGFFVSYNPYPEANPLVLMIDAIGDLGMCKQDETAIVDGDNYYILFGDWRKQYEKLVPKGKAACIKFFKSKEKKHKSPWSN